MAYRGRHTSTLLREIINRIADQCAETGREDLVEAAYLISDLIADPRSVANPRKAIVEILERDDWLVDAVGLLDRDRRQWVQVARILDEAVGGTVH